MPHTKKQKILIVGGGFGGIKAALELSKNELLHVVLLTNTSQFRYYPSLYHTATGGSKMQSSIPLSTIFEGKNVSILIGTATKLDRENKLLITGEGQTIFYTKLVLALGVTTNYFGIKGLEEYAYGIKSVDEAEKLKSHLHQQLIDEHKPDLNYLVIGGGPTGIELAGQLPDYMKRVMRNHGIAHRAIHINLIEAAPRLLPRLPRDASRVIARRLRKLKIKLSLNQKVEAETADALVVNGTSIKSHTVIWTAGVTNHAFFKNNGFKLSDKGKVIVDDYLRTEPNIYVLGDNADTPYSGMAQTALHDALSVTGNITAAVARKDMKKYRPKKPITVIPVGNKWAAVVDGPLRIYGRLGWWLREAADLIGFHNLEPWWKASEQYLTEYLTEESCPVCAIAEAKH